jgi:hypothetical protein
VIRRGFLGSLLGGLAGLLGLKREAEPLVLVSDPLTFLDAMRQELAKPEWLGRPWSARVWWPEDLKECGGGFRVVLSVSPPESDKGPPTYECWMIPTSWAVTPAEVQSLRNATAVPEDDVPLPDPRKWPTPL